MYMILFRGVVVPFCHSVILERHVIKKRKKEKRNTAIHNKDFQLLSSVVKFTSLFVRLV